MVFGVRSRFWTGTIIYAGMVLALLVVSFLNESTIGPAVYLAAAGVTLPMGVLIYPALWVNVFATGFLADALHLGDGVERALSLAGVAVVFVLAAVANALVARGLWRARSLRGLSNRESEH